MQKMAEEVITRGVPEGTLRIGVVVGHGHISLVLATMSTLVVDTGGKLNQQNLSIAIKKSCDKLVTSLLKQ